jgi:hypothetical protein
VHDVSAAALGELLPAAAPLPLPSAQASRLAAHYSQVGSAISSLLFIAYPVVHTLANNMDVCNERL